MTTPQKSSVASSQYTQLNDAVEQIGAKPVHMKIFLLIALGGIFSLIEQYNIGYAAPIIVEQWNLSQAAVGLLSTVTFGAMAVSSLVSGVAADRFGRKPLFMANVALYTFGALIAAFAPNYETLLIARVVVGLGLGGEMALGYTVISELIPTKKRGAASAGLSLTHGGIGIFAAGGLAALVLGPLAPVLGGGQIAWRVLLGVMFAPAVLVLFYRRYIPETPRYQIRVGRIDEANRILTLLAANKLRDSRNIEITGYIDSAKTNTESIDAVGLKDLFAGYIVKRTFIAWILSVFLFASVASLTLFMPTILVDLGFSPGSSASLATGISFGGLLGGILGILCAHRIPRRIVGAGFSVVNVISCLAITQISSPVTTLVLGFTIAFSLQALSGSFWGYLPELYPTKLRGYGAGVAVTVALIVGATAGPLLAGSVLDSSGQVGLFVLLGAFSLIYGVTALMGPETHGKALTES